MGKGGSGLCRFRSGTGQLLGLRSVAALDFGSPALRVDTAAAQGGGCARASKGRGSPCSFPRSWPLRWSMPKLRGEGHLFKRERKKCLRASHSPP